MGNFIINSSPRLIKSPLTDVTHKAASIKELPVDRDLGRTRTDRLYLIGHADGLELNDPIQVVSLQDIVTYLGADTSSPLLRATFDAYNEGARDIWIVAAAPMSEYIDDISNRNTPLAAFGSQTFYELYHSRLATTYNILREYSEPEIIVPLEAPFYYTENVDFLTQLADHCADAFNNTGRIRLGFLGTRISTHITTETEDMASDTRLSSVKDSQGGMFVSIIGGEVLVSHPQISTAYSISAATLAAARLSTMKMSMGLVHRNLLIAISPSYGDYTDSQYSELALSGVNWIKRSRLGQRGVPYQVYCETDNILSSDISSIWSMAHIRVMSKVVNQIQAMGSVRIGSVGYPKFKHGVISYMERLKIAKLIKGYNLNIYRDSADPYKVIVDVNIRPYGTLREVFLSIAVGNTSARK